MAHKQVPIPSLTGVRGIAACWVFLSHFSKLAAEVLHAPWLTSTSFLFNGFRGVDLFFVLSGFILMHVHANDFITITRRELRSFFVTRFFRVYPLNTAVLLALVPLVLLAPSYVAMQRAFTSPHFAYRAHNLSFAGFIQTLLLAQSWTVLKLGEWNIVSWTLSAEVLGYMLFPAFAWALIRENSWRRCLAYGFASLALLTALLFVCHHANNNPTGTFGSLRMLLCFAAGISLYRCYQLIPPSRVPAVQLTIIAPIFIGGALLIPAASVLDVFAFAALIFGLAYRQGPVNAALQSRLAVYLGKISFSFYLTHFLIIGIVYWAIGHWLTQQNLSLRVASLLAVAALCLAAATGFYHGVERPSQRLGRRLAKPMDAIFSASRTAYASPAAPGE